MDPFDHAGATALVTGAASGIGAALAEQLAARGTRHQLTAKGVGVTVVHPGGVRTRIAETVRVGSGVSAEEADEGRARFATLLTIPPEKAAARILAAVERRRPRLLIGWSARIPDALVRVLPGSYRTLVARAAGRRVGPPARD